LDSKGIAPWQLWKSQANGHMGDDFKSVTVKTVRV